jgi:hypothetical protein
MNRDDHGYGDQLVVRLSRKTKKDLRETGKTFSMRISDFARVAIIEGLKQIRTRGAIEAESEN